MNRLRDLHAELRSRQQRLGTPAELPSDFDAVLRLAHDINNQVTVELMRAMLEADASPTLASICRRALSA